jgi:hypothetical protein
MARQPDSDARIRWARLIALQRESDLTIAQFCNRHEVSTASFYQWRRKLPTLSDSPGQFLPVQVETTPGLRSMTQVQFPCGTRIDFDSADTAALNLVLDRLVPSEVSR